MDSFKEISIRDLPCWVKAMKADPPIEDKLDMLGFLTLIDDLLTIQKCQALLNRKRNLKAQLEARIGLDLGIIPQLEAIRNLTK